MYTNYNTKAFSLTHLIIFKYTNPVRIEKEICIFMLFFL